VQCRRAAEYALRRKQSLLVGAQRCEQRARFLLSTARSWRRASAEESVAFWVGEVERLEAELRELLADPITGHGHGFDAGRTADDGSR
jgi:hypothetical protein